MRVFRLVHYSTVVLTESAGVCTNRFFHEAPILRRVFMKLVVFVSTLKFVLCIVCMRLSPIRCTIQLVLTERLFPRSTRIEGCIHEIDCFCEHLKKKRAVTNCLLSFTTVVSTKNESLGGQISLKMTCIHIPSGCFPFPGIPSGCFPFPATKKKGFDQKCSG